MPLGSPRGLAASLASSCCLVAIVACVTSAPAAVRTQSRTSIPRVGQHVANEIRTNFIETVIATGLDSPVSMTLAPDSRAFVCEQRGTLRVIRDGRLLARPFVTLPTKAEVEEGLLGVACDPAFEQNHFVYVCWTALEPHRHQRVSRFTASGDTALAGSETVLIDLDDNGEHNLVGGALRFGRDGMLYVSTGENGIGPLSQSLGSTDGKLLRIRPDGSVPADNPFVATTSGHHQAIWARGFRNPFSFDVDPASGRIFVNDVGASAVEEVNEAIAGGNYGWPLFEGPGGDSTFRQPIQHYDHDHGCAVTGAAFYSPHATGFPREWIGRYFYGEYCLDQIRWLDPAHPEKTGVFGITMVLGPVDFRVAADGSLWYLARGNSGPMGGDGTASGSVVRVSYSPIDPLMASPRNARNR